MINRHLLTNDIDEPSIERLLEPSRVTLCYENLIKDEGLKTWMNIDLLVEPFELKVGFRENEFFNQLNKRASEFQAVLSGSDEDVDMTLDTEIDIDKELNKFKKRDLQELNQAITASSGDKRAVIKKDEVKLNQFIKSIAN